MKFVFRIIGSSRVLITAALSISAVVAETPKEAEVTQIIREVKLLPAAADPRDAMVKDKVTEDTGVRTGDESRSELTFADLTITRLGANTIFSFSKAGRTANVDSGSILLRVPKNSGGGAIKNSVVTVAITGTTVIFEAAADGASRLITLEGSSKLSFTNNPGQVRRVRAGQMLEVPAGATTLPMPVYIDLRELMRTHPLIVDFRPLPSQPLIMAVAEQRPPPRTPKQPSPPTSPQGPVTGPGTGGPGPTGPGPVGPGVQPSPTVKSFPSPTARPIGSTPTPTPSATVPPKTSPSPTGRPIGSTPTPTPSATAPSKASPSPTGRPIYSTPTPTPSPTAPPKPSPTPTARPTRTATPTPTPTATYPPKPSPTPRQTPTPRVTPSPKPTPKPTAKPTPSPKASPKPTRHPINTRPTPTPTQPPIITRTNPTQGSTPIPKSTPRIQRVIKRPTPPPVR
jgi:FecR-like protein